MLEITKWLFLFSNLMELIWLLCNINININIFWCNITVTSVNLKIFEQAFNRKIVFLFLNQHICCGYSKEPSQWEGSFEHPKHMLKIIGKKIFTILHWNFVYLNLCWSTETFYSSTTVYNKFMTTEHMLLVKESGHWSSDFWSQLIRN